MANAAVASDRASSAKSSICYQVLIVSVKLFCCPCADIGYGLHAALLAIWVPCCAAGLSPIRCTHFPRVIPHKQEFSMGTFSCQECFHLAAICHRPTD